MDVSFPFPVISVPLPDSLFPQFDFPTDIRFTLPKTGDWAATVYDVLGDPVIDFSGRGKKGRQIIIEWDGLDAAGIEHPAGVYFCRITSRDWTITRQFILLR